NLAAADDFNGLHQRGVDREHALHAFAVGDLADGEALLEARAGAGDADAFIGLYAGAGAFGDTHLYTHGIAGLELRELSLCFNLGGLFGLELTDNVHRENPLLVLRTARALSLARQHQSRLAMPFRQCLPGRSVSP